MWHDLIVNGAKALGRELLPIHLKEIFPHRHCDDMRRKCRKEKNQELDTPLHILTSIPSSFVVVLLLGGNSFSLKIASVFQLLKNHKKKSFECKVMKILFAYMHDYFNTKKSHIKVKNPSLNHLIIISLSYDFVNHQRGFSLLLFGIMYHVSKDRATHSSV